MKKVRDGYKEYEFGVIPNDWQVKKLGDIFNDLKGGSTPSRLIDRYYTGDIPWITSGELKYKTIYNTLESITEEAVKDTNLKLYPQGTFFIAITGLEAEGTRGSCAITGVPATTNQSCLAFQPKEGFSNLYLYHWYRLYGNYIGLKYTQGTKQQSLNNKIVGKLEIPVPKLEEQEKIASILSTVDEQIDNVDALIEKNKELKKGLMQTLLTKGIGHTKFKKTEIGEIPEEWEVINAGRVFNIITDYVANGSFASLAENVKYKESEDFAIVVRLTDYKNEYKGPFVYVDKNAYDFLSKSKLEDNDIIIANVGAYAGYVFRAPNINKPITLGPNAILVRSEQNREFIYYLLSSEFGQKAIKDIISTTAQPKFNKTDFKKILLPIPDLKEQYKIASILLEIDEKTEEYEKKKQKLEELKKGLMQQLLTGRIRV